MSQPGAFPAAVREYRAVIRTRTYSNHRYTVDEVIAELREQRFTGRVTIDISQGGVCAIEAQERSPLPYLACNNNHA